MSNLLEFTFIKLKQLSAPLEMIMSNSGANCTAQWIAVIAASTVCWRLPFLLKFTIDATENDARVLLKSSKPCHPMWRLFVLPHHILHFLPLTMALRNMTGFHFDKDSVRDVVVDMGTFLIEPSIVVGLCTSALMFSGSLHRLKGSKLGIGYAAVSTGVLCLIPVAMCVSSLSSFVLSTILRVSISRINTMKRLNSKKF